MRKRMNLKIGRDIESDVMHSDDGKLKDFLRRYQPVAPEAKVGELAQLLRRLENEERVAQLLPRYRTIPRTRAFTSAITFGGAALLMMTWIFAHLPPAPQPRSVVSERASLEAGLGSDANDNSDPESDLEQMDEDMPSMAIGAEYLNLIAVN